MPVEAKRKREFEDWNQDAGPLLDAIDAAEEVLRDAGYADRVTMAAYLSWPNAEAHESSTADARQRLLVAGLLSSAFIHITGWTTDGRSASVEIEAVGSKWWHLYTLAPEVALVERMHEAVVREAERAAVPSGVESALEPSPNGQAHSGVVGWMESHPALTGAIFASLGIVAAVAIAIAGN